MKLKKFTKDKKDRNFYRYNHYKYTNSTKFRNNISLSQQHTTPLSFKKQNSQYGLLRKD